MFKRVLEKSEEKFDTANMVKNIHDWLRAKGVLDENHDLPFNATPTQYRKELEDVVNGRFRKDA